MTIIACATFALIILGAACCIARGIARKQGWRRHSARDPLRRVFRRRELRDLDRHLERVAVDERRRVELDALRYVAGEVGYVVVVAGSRHGIGLGLSDGHRLELGGVSRSSLTLLERAVAHKLRPAHVIRHGLSYRLMLRTEAGLQVEIFAQRLALAM